MKEIRAPRKTLKNSVKFEGRALHGGQPVSVTVHPADQAEIVFRKKTESFVARPEFVTSTSRCTVLGTISTIEHLMSAFAGLGISDAIVEVEGDELPGMDGSAKPFYDEMLAVGLEAIGEIAWNPPFARVFQKDESSMVAIRNGAGRWQYDYFWEHGWPGTMSYETDSVLETYGHQIVQCRTFVHESQLAQVQAAGMGQGLDENSAVILGDNGYLNEVRCEDEPARHKLLDLIGDLYLSGIPIHTLDVHAEKSGHKANVAAAMQLAQICPVRYE